MVWLGCNKKRKHFQTLGCLTSDYWDHRIGNDNWEVSTLVIVAFFRDKSNAHDTYVQSIVFESYVIFDKARWLKQKQI